MTSITEIPHNPVVVEPAWDEGEWEAFWPGAVNGTLFHSLRFLAYHPPGRFEIHNVTFRRKGNLVGIMPGAVRSEDGRRVWISHPGASYGGPAWSCKLHYSHLEELVRALVVYARRQGFAALRLTPPPVIYNPDPVQALDFALRRGGFKALRTELTQAVRLDAPPEALFASFVNKTRNAFRRAEKLGVRFRIVEQPTTAEFDRFWEILEENRRGLGVVPTHSRAEIERLHQLIPEYLMLAVIEHNGRMLAGIWNFICNREVVLEFYMAHEAPAVPFKPVPYLTYHSLLWAREKGLKWMDFGISSIWGEPTWGLLKFKENFNARHFLRQTWQIDL